MDMGYVATPFLAWLIAGSIKFIINSIQAGKLAFNQIGYGGLPSNHSAIVSSTVTLIAFREGLDNPIFGVALTLAFIVFLDATNLRRQIGKQAEAINRMKISGQEKQLRERMGHTQLEIGAGIAVGIFTAWLVEQFFFSVV